MSAKTTLSVYFDSHLLEPVGTGGRLRGWVTVRIDIGWRHTSVHHFPRCTLRTSFYVQPWTKVAANGDVVDLLRRYEFSDEDTAQIHRWLCDFGRTCLALPSNGKAKSEMEIPNVPFTHAGFHPTLTMEEVLRR